MKTLNLNGKLFQLEPDVFKFLEDYVERIASFVEKNHIEADLHQDILQRLADKLAEKAIKKDWITQKIAIQIVNNLWEPEEIFAEESDFEPLPQEKKSGASQRSAPFYEKFQNSKWSRPQENAILLWVCGMFAQVSGRNVRIWRGLTLFANWIILAGGMGNAFLFGRMCYFVLALIFPRKEKDYEGESVLNYFLTQIWDLRLGISNLFRFGLTAIQWIFGTVIPTLLKRGAKLFWPLWWLVKIGFLLIRSGLLLFLLFNLGILFYYLQVWYIWNNVDMTSLFPAITPWGVALGFLSAFLLLLGSIGALFKKKLMNTASLITAIISWILAIIIASITGIQFFSYFAVPQSQTYTKEIQIPIADKSQSLTIDVEPNNFTFPFLPFADVIEESSVINYFPYEGDSIKAVFSYKIYANDKKTFAKITENLSDPTYEIKDGTLQISHKDHKLFDTVVPLAIMRYSVDLYIPTDWKFNIANSIHANNLHKPERANKRWYHGDYEWCSDWITYDEKENAFFCPMEFDITKYGIRYTIENDIRNNKADELSPLEGLNPDWSFAQHNNHQYWNLHSILWKDNQKFIVKLSDQMFNIFLEVEATVNEMWEIKYTKSTVKEVEQKGIMTPEKMSFYKWWEKLKNFDIKIQDSPKEDEYVSKKEFDDLLKKLENQGVSLEDE